MSADVGIQGYVLCKSTIVAVLIVQGGNVYALNPTPFSRPVSANRLSENSAVRFRKADSPIMRDLRLTGLDWSFVLRPRVNRAGRSVENELHLHESSVSGFHCEIHVSERMILVKDLGSTNGTFVDGKPVQESAILPGQVLRLGFVELQLEEQAVEISIPALNFDQ